MATLFTRPATRLATAASAVLLAAGLVLGGPLAASAATLTAGQIQAVTNLLVAFGVDSATIANVQTALGATPSTVASTTSSSIVTSNMIGYLRLGATGNNVKYLQALLAADPDVYPAGLITGYYGTLTQQAVQRFQQKHQLTSVGYVGPLTLSKLQDLLDENPIAVSTSTSSGTVCAVVPPGHLIAPGWRRHNDTEDVIPTCQSVPPGIAWQYEHRYGYGTTTTPTPTDTTPPTITGLAVGSITTSSAKISWTTNEAATGVVSIGTTTSYGRTVTQWPLYTTVHAVTVDNLASSTLYHFSVRSVDAAGNATVSGDMTFTTATPVPPDTTAPVISSISVGSLASTSATVSWTTNEAATSKVYFGTTTPLVFSTAASRSSSTLTTSHALTLTPLVASTTYYYAVQSADSSGNVATSSQASFVTP